MSINLIRMRNAAIAVKIEANVGVDAIADSPTIGDFIAGEIEVAYEQDQYPNTEVTGSKLRKRRKTKIWQLFRFFFMITNKFENTIFHSDMIFCVKSPT